MNFLEWKSLYFDGDFAIVYYEKLSLQNVVIGPGNGLVSQKAIG